jgi:hypothetical protein
MHGKNMSIARGAFTLSEVALILGVSRDTVERLLARRILRKFERIGAIRVTTESLEALISVRSRVHLDEMIVLYGWSLTLSASEVGSHLHICDDSVYRMIAKGIISKIPFLRRCRIPKWEIDRGLSRIHVQSDW